MDEQNNKNFILALVLSFAVLVVWQIFYGFPEMQKERDRKAQEQAAQSAGGAAQETQDLARSTAPRPSPQAGPSSPPSGIARPQETFKMTVTRAAALAASPRIAINTPNLRGSIALRGAQIDDLILAKYINTIDPESGNVVLLSPSRSENSFYAEHGWVGGPGVTLKLPTPDTLWRAESSNSLGVGRSVTLTWDNGAGLVFRRTVSVDENFMFTVTQEVENRTTVPVTLHPYALVSRRNPPEGQGFIILHEGFTGVFGDEGQKEEDYDESEFEMKDGRIEFMDVTGGWLGFTDKYWAAVLIPNQEASFKGKYWVIGEPEKMHFQADYLLGPITIAAGTKANVEGRVFAGARQVSVIDGYHETLGILKFDLMVDWGMLYFLTKPLFQALDFFYKLVGNFGVAILIVTTIIKLILFPLANKSYVSMSRMKKLTPEIERLKKRHEGDMIRQQQAIGELYKKEKVSPAAGCLPAILQIPVFLALYKVLFVSIEMRQAPFYGWIKDLSARDPTSIWNLFGLLPYDPGAYLPGYLMVGAWPVVMGLIMFIQMKLNPAPTDPMQAKMFAWMPLFFTFILAPFPAGLVVYWTWNNLLSATQQYYIMARQGVEVALWENLGFKSKQAASQRPKT